MDTNTNTNAKDTKTNTGKTVKTIELQKKLSKLSLNNSSCFLLLFYENFAAGTAAEI